MNITELSNMQDTVDKKVEERFNINTSQIEYMDRLMFAFKVELGELANVNGFFKFWKGNHQIDKLAEREELIDCIHLLLSIGNKRGYTDFVQDFDMDYDMYEDYPLEELFYLVMGNQLDSSGQWRMAFMWLLVIGHKLGFSEEDIVNEYKRKNEINQYRQRSEY